MAYDPRKEHLSDIDFRRKELEKERQKRLKEEAKQQAKLRKAEEDATKAVWINSTQSFTGIKDVIDSIIVTSDDRYLKIIEVVPVNFEMMDVVKQNRIGDAFSGLIDIIPSRIQIKCFTRKGDVNSMISTMKANMQSSDNQIIRDMQSNYLDLVRDTASTIGITRRYFIILENDDSARATGTNLDNITSSLNLYASMLKSHLAECGNLVLDTGDSTFGVNSILYEIMNRRLSETVPFSEHAEEVFASYEEASLSNENTDEKGNRKTATPMSSEFIAPAWMDFTHRSYCVVDGKYYSYFFMDGNRFPYMAYTGWLSTFVDYCEGVDVDIFIRKEPTERVQRSISQNQVFNQTKKYSTESTDSYTTMNKISSGSYILQALAEGQEYFNVSILVTVSADTLEDLEYRSSSLTKAARSRQILLRPCNFMEEEAFRSALPLCRLSRKIDKKARRNMTSDGTASLYPFLSFELQDPNGIMLGVNNRNNSLVSVDLYDTSIHTNSNATIMGASGYGKTFTAQLFAVRYRLQGIQSYIITPLKGDVDYKRTCDRIGGQYLYLGPGTAYSINICDIIPPDETAEDDTNRNSWLAQKILSLHTFFNLTCPDITTEEDRLLDEFFYEAYREKGITDDNRSVYDPVTGELKEMPVLGDIHRLMKRNPKLDRIYNLMQPYITGAHKEFNQRTNVDLNNLYICFDMGGMNGQDLYVSMFVVIDFVWSRVKQNIATKKTIFFDELWKLISVAGNDMAAAYCLEIFKTIRSYGGSAICMTQEVGDFFNYQGGIYGKGIIGNSDTKICLRLNDKEVRTLREILDLAPAEMEAISSYPRGTGLLITGSSRVEVAFKASDKELLTISTDPKLAREEREEQERRKKALERLKASANQKGERA